MTPCFFHPQGKLRGSALTAHGTHCTWTIELIKTLSKYIFGKTDVENKAILRQKKTHFAQKHD
jgi:hypothetical protein